MSRPELNQRTSATVDFVERFGPDGFPWLAVVIKQLFRYLPNGETRPVPGAEVRVVDEPWPDAESPRLPSDHVLRKPSTDVIVVGSAVSPSGPVKSLDVLVKVGPVQQALRVHGPRVWYRGLTGIAIGDAEPFERLPLRWEDAYGGKETGDDGRFASEPKNPHGKGVAIDAKTLVHQPAPRIEDPAHPIRGTSRQVPAGVAAIGPEVEPRLSYAGTMDQRWQDERMPLAPLDLDERFHQSATPSLITPAALRGGEEVALLHIGKPGATKLALPARSFRVTARRDAGVDELRPMLDTVIVRADEALLELTWRAATTLPRTRPVRAITVYERRSL